MVSAEKKHLLAVKVPPDESDSKIRIDQAVFATIVMLPAFSGGMTVAFPAIAIPELTSLSLSETAWFSSIPTLSSIISLLLTGLLIDRYGRQKMLIFSLVTVATGFYFISISTSVLTLYTGQFFCGLCQGSMTISSTVYVTESIAPNNLRTRNSLTCGTVLAINIGMFFVYVVGAFCHYSEVAMIAAILSLIWIIVIMLFIPESPTWLQEKGKHEDAAKARKRISFQTEISTNVANSCSLENEVRHECFWTYLKKIQRKDIYKPICITTGIFSILNVAGVVVCSMNIVDILSVNYLPINSSYLAIVSGFLLIVSQLTYIVVVPRIGIKKLVMLASAGTGLAATLLTLSLYLNQSEHWYSYLIDYIHIVTVLIYSYSSGIVASLPYSIVSELFPVDGQGFSAITYICNSLTLSAMLMLYQYGVAYISYHIYIVFAAASFFNIWYIYYVVPETVGKTLQELSDGFIEQR